MSDPFGVTDVGSKTRKRQLLADVLSLEVWRWSNIARPGQPSIMRAMIYVIIIRRTFVVDVVVFGLYLDFFFVAWFNSVFDRFINSLQQTERAPPISWE